MELLYQICYNLEEKLLTEIEFYEDERGFSDLREFIGEVDMKAETSKDARINRNKIVAYLDALEEMGTQIEGSGKLKKLEGERCELRPLYQTEYSVLVHFRRRQVFAFASFL